MIIVDRVDIQIHRHLSGREFTEDDACVKKVKEKLPNTIKEEEASGINKTTEMNIEDAREAYKTKYGKYPSNLMKIENIIAKL